MGKKTATSKATRRTASGRGTSRAGPDGARSGSGSTSSSSSSSSTKGIDESPTSIASASAQRRCDSERKPAPAPPAFRVVIIGGGFGGLAAAKGIRRRQRSGARPLEVTLIDKTNHHLFQPLLYQVASAALSPSDIAYPIREVVAAMEHVRVVLGEVTRIDPTTRRVAIAAGDEFEYDALIVAAGSRHSYFGRDEWERVAPGLKTIDDAIHIRNKILLAFEKAERLATAGRDSQGALNFVVVGGGPTGVEMAGAIAEIAHKTLLRNFRHINPREARVIVVESAPQLLASYPPDLAEAARQSLFKLGVGVRLATRVVDVHPDRVALSSGEIIPTETVIWAAGNVSSPLVEQLGGDLVGRSRRVRVAPDCSLPAHPDIFVIGDAAHFDATTPDGAPLVGVVQVAVQQAAYVARILNEGATADISRRRSERPFVYHDKGSMATIGRCHAVVWMGRLHLSGVIAWLLWAAVHVFFLINFRSRLLVLMQWSFLYMTGGRGARLINVRSPCSS